MTSTCDGPRRYADIVDSIFLRNPPGAEVDDPGDGTTAESCSDRDIYPNNLKVVQELSIGERQ